MYLTKHLSMNQPKNRLYFFLGLLAIYLLLTVATVFAQDMTDTEYRPFPKIGSRNAAWIAAQLHLLFGSFILGVPMFAVVIEFVGMKTKDKRYDKMAQEFIKLCMGAFSTTALLGGVLVFILIWCYPQVMNKMTGIFGPTMIFYVFLFFGETFTLYLYSYGWDRMQGKVSKMWHLFLGVLLNVFGTAIMFVSNAWLTYQTSPAGIDEETGHFVGTTWQAVNNFTWMPVNIHRLIGNVAFGGAIVGAYSAFRFLAAKTQEDKSTLRLDGIYRQFYRAVWTDSAPIRRILVGTRNLYIQQHDGHQHDGEPLFVVVHHSGGNDWGAVYRSELLSLVWHDPHRRRGEIRSFSSLHDRYHCSICSNLDDAAHIDYVAQGDGCNRRFESPARRIFRLDDREEYGCQSHHLDHLSQFSILPPIR